MADGDQKSELGALVGDLAGLGKTGEALIAAISKLVEGLAAPFQTRRLGYAQTDVETDRLIRTTEAQMIAEALKAGDLGLRERAGSRLVARELGRQKNLEKVLALAAAQIKAEWSAQQDQAEPIDDDWMETYFRYVENVSNADIQAIWARVLTQQVKGAGRGVSLATLDSLRLLEPHLARAFERVAKAWAAFGVVLDIDVGIESADLSIYSHEHLALQGLGLIEIVAKREYYLQGKGYAFVFSQSDDPDLNAMDYHDVDFSQIRLSWRGIELCGVLFPGLLEWDPRMEGHLETPVDLAGWSSLDMRATVIAHWLEMLGSMAPAIVLGHHASTSPEAMLVRSQSVFTHVWTDILGWRRRQPQASTENSYPQEIQQLLAASIPASDPRWDAGEGQAI
ncbi:DUF2806 domain-containing protein [Caulobacter sp.]|uniref:DUF2806 domain-containing protein n=1 Tax=Caulobacter sp. TaxID=78 RepID=UPI0031CEEB77